MKILLLGKNGQVGWELRHTLAPLGDITALDKEDLDLTDFAATRGCIREVKPDLIVNAAAYTAVDRAESEPDLAMAVNGELPGVLAEEALKIKCGLIHYSTDYVFDGTKEAPYLETDVPAPQNIYGQSKLAGENNIRESGAAHLILRTSWVYGSRGANFFLTMLRLARQMEEIRVVNDQIGAPTWCRMIAEATALIIARGLPEIHDFLTAYSGIYNMTAAGRTSWYDFTKAILAADPFRQEQICQKVKPIPTKEYPTPAARPRFSVLSNHKLGESFNINLPDWHSQLQAVFGL